MNQRELFYKHLAQTSPAPLALEIERSEGIYLYDTEGRSYVDFISGIAVSNVGHSHPKVVAAIKKQADTYLHTNVYGEYVLSPQVQLAHKLASYLPSSLDSVYFVNSGTEAIEGAMKLAKRFTGRSELISCYNAYHGSSSGSLSLMGDLEFTRAFRPLIPDVRKIRFGKIADLELITHKTAAVFIEPIQGEAGIRLADVSYWQALSKRCKEQGALLVFDEIQTGFGRTGKLFAFEHLGIVPDILTLAKGLGGGMPLGAFVASENIMHTLTYQPALGHITTFGGHPLSCAAALASLSVITEENLPQEVAEKSELLATYLSEIPTLKEIRKKGLMMALEFGDKELNFKYINSCLQQGIIVDWFLFCDTAMRIAPPLTISKSEIKEVCERIVSAIKENL
ncbi:MAG: aspartate aminotransferase family protein [Bacteroidales bacterium]|nr:aspartate aminotransferase family protein [Bacteroidales bacterium]